MCGDFTSSPMLTLTLLIGKGWMSIFGDSLISYRVLNWMLWILSALLPYFILVPSDLRIRNLKFVSLSLILTAVLNFNMYGGDVSTLFFLTLSASFIIKYYYTNKVIHLLIFGICSSLLILVRFPNILMVLAFIVVLGIMEYSKNYPKLPGGRIVLSFVKKISVYFVVCIACYLLIIRIIYGSLSEFTSKLTLSILNTDESHTIITMVKVYLKHFVKLFQYVGVCFLLFIIINNKLNFSLLIQRILTILALLFFILFLKVEIGIGGYNVNISLFYSAIICSILILNSIFHFHKQENDKLVFISIILILAIIPVLGSTTGLFRYAPFLISFLPVILVSNQSVFQEKPDLRYLFVIFILFTVYTKMMFVYEDSNITNLKYEFKTEKLKHIRTTRANVEYIDDVLKVFEGFEKDKKTVLFYGKVSHVFYYLTDTKPLCQVSFWMPPYDLNEVKKVEQTVISNRPVVIFVPSYPEISAQNFKNRNSISPFEEMLIENGYYASAKNSFIIYNP